MVSEDTRRRDGDRLLGVNLSTNFGDLANNGKLNGGVEVHGVDRRGLELAVQVVHDLPLLPKALAACGDKLTQ
jgi:hypothetical protein